MKLPTRRSVAIVADGPSAAPLRHITIPQEVYVIGVNHASIWLPRCDAYMTANPDHRQRFVMNNQRVGVRYFAAVPMAYGSVLAEGSNHGPRERNVSFFRQCIEPGMSDDPRYCSVGIEGLPRNSVYAALNLACHLGAQRIAIFGMDCSNAPRVSGGRAGGLHGVPALMEHYDGQAQVLNASLSSPVDAFPRVGNDHALTFLL